MKKRLSLDLQSPLFAWGLVVLLTLIWGSTFFMVKKALEVYNPLEVFAVRAFVASLILAPFSFKALDKISKRAWWGIAAFALTATLSPPILYAMAQTQISSSMTGILNAATPLMTLVIGGWFFGQRMLKNQWLGLILGMIGTTYLVLGNGVDGLFSVNWLAMLAILATVCNGFSGNVLKFRLGGVPATQIAGLAFWLVFPIALGVLLYYGVPGRIMAGGPILTATAYLVFLGIFANALAMVLVSKLIQVRGPIFASLITYTIPVVALFWGWLDNERITWDLLVAAAGIILSIWIVNRASD
ncbi:MAG: DMT family transporter [Bacteroidota bacterium]